MPKTPVSKIALNIKTKYQNHENAKPIAIERKTFHLYLELYGSFTASFFTLIKEASVAVSPNFSVLNN